MQKVPFELIQCWRDERVDQVINKEAAFIDRATFLATHMPLQNLEYKRELRRVVDKSEEALLRELQRCATEDLHAFVVVQGIPGTGKSHLIRWLKERYLSEESEPRECVLFIARAECSLSSTLEQIIRSGIFDEATMREQLEQLQGARLALSQEALADTLLDQLRIASKEETSVEIPSWLRRQKGLELFLLDYHVREELKKPGGPIDRLVRFLRSGPGAGIFTSEVPHFEEQDFDFARDVRSKIREQGYNEVKLFADRMSGEDGLEKRQELASTLNQLVRYAIGHATALTGDDFKQVFADLRSYLYSQGRNLALFIEDITVLTGIDRGLLDVLVTQHKGEGMQEQCRLISVVGITDSYYHDLVPDNIKDRITYHVALSEENTALALNDAHALENLASRYLNAMRLEEEELETWASHHAYPDELPNACNRCPWQETCHRAFGYYTLNADSESEQRIGLYPFNRQALHTFYQHIDTTKNSQTQRAFLYHVLHYLLQSHGPRLKQRSFPPARAEMGGEFIDFSLAKLLQQEIIRNQGKFDWGRIMTLVTIWGNRTVDAVAAPDGSMLVGALTPQVFRAFGLPVIAGEPVVRVAEPARVPALLPPVPKTPSAQPVQRSTDPVFMVIPAAKIDSQPSDKLRKYHEDIASWLDGGSLRYYEDYAEALAPFLRSSIDWDFYGISQFQVAEVLKGRRNLHIEGQVGKTNAAYYYTLPRSAELGYVLQGLVELKELGQHIEPAVAGAYLSQCSLWVNQHEQAIVDFVRRPDHTSPDILPLVQIVLLDCLLLACLQGELKASYKNTQDLFLDLIRFCVQNRSSGTHWETQTRLAIEKRSQPWARFLKRFKSRDVKDLCENCLQLLNCAQGSSSDVKFVDASTGIRILKEFRRNKWQMPDPGPMGDTTRESWRQALTVYRDFQEQFVNALQGERESIQQQLQTLASYTGEDAYQDTFLAIAEMVQTAQESGRGLNFVQNPRLSASNLQNIVKELGLVLDISGGEASILRCARASKRLEEAREYSQYFKTFVDATENMKKSGEGRLAKLQQETEALAFQEIAQKLYCEITEALRSLNQSGGAA